MIKHFLFNLQPNVCGRKARFRPPGDPILPGARHFFARLTRLMAKNFSPPYSSFEMQVPGTCASIHLVPGLFLTHSHILHAAHVTHQAFEFHQSQGSRDLLDRQVHFVAQLIHMHRVSTQQCI